MKKKILIGLHWSVLIFLVISAIIFFIEVSPLANPDDVLIKDNHVLFCENGHCVKLGEKIYWTFLELFIVEMVLGGLALFAIMETVSLEKRIE